MFQKSVLIILGVFALSHVIVFADTVTTANDTSTLGIDHDQARSGDFSFDDLPRIIVGATEWILAFSATISIVVIIYGAIRMQIGSGMFGAANIGKGKNAIMAGITGFIISALAWIIVYGVVTLISQSSSG